MASDDQWLHDVTLPTYHCLGQKFLQSLYCVVRPRYLGNVGTYARLEAGGLRSVEQALDEKLSLIIKICGVPRI